MTIWKEPTGEITKGHEETFGMMDMLVILGMVMVSQFYNIYENLLHYTISICAVFSMSVIP